MSTQRSALVANTLAPELAIEVASPGQSGDDLAAKAGRYLRGGTRLVWIVWPEEQSVDVWHPGDSAPSTTLHIAAALDGESVVPGFRQPPAAIFDL
jgi:Uma2 family endonuclease